MAGASRVARASEPQRTVGRDWFSMRKLPKRDQRSEVRSQRSEVRGQKSQKQGSGPQISQIPQIRGNKRDSHRESARLVESVEQLSLGFRNELSENAQESI